MRPPVYLLALLLLTLPQLAIASDGDQDVARLDSLLQQYSSLADAMAQQRSALSPEAYGCTPGLTDGAIATPNIGLKAWMMPETPIGSNGDYQSYSCVGTGLAVWGRATGGQLPITWSLRFGDDMMTTGTATTYALANNITADHVYASAGWKTAVLTVTDGLNNVDSASVNIYVETACDSVVIINSAIEKGLRWLYLNQCPNGRLADGGGDYDVAGTSLALLALHLRGHSLNDTTATSTGIYGFTVQKATDYLLSQLHTYSACMTSPYPDVNGDGLGLFFGSGLGYSNGMAIMGLASGYANESAYVPRSGVAAGWPMSRILQDCMDQLYNAQSTSGVYRGGWRYQVNTCDYGSSDNSLVQWAVLALEACKEAGFPVADSCRNELAHWTAYSQCGSTGGFGYTGACDGWNNVAKTASGLMSLDFIGATSEDPRAVAAQGRICNVWNTAWDGSGYAENLNGNFYAMYSLAKSCRSMMDVNGQQLDMLQPGNIDWYSVYWHRLTDPTSPHRQQLNGSWTNTTVSYIPGGMANLTTGLALLTLIPAVIICHPVAVPVLNPPASSCPSLLVTLDGSTSFDQCQDRRIVEWLWDYDLSDNSGFFPDTSAMIAQHLYVLPPSETVHTFTGALRVRDDQDSTNTMTFTVELNSTNNAPIACAQVGCTNQPYAGPIGQPITFDGSSSFDPDACQGDSIAVYSWDLDGDGVYEISGPDPVVSRSWPERYIGQISLQVCDTHGLCSESASRVSVYASELNLSIQASDITFTPDCSVVAQDHVINANVRLATLDGAAADLPETRVDFYDGNPNVGGALIGQQIIPAGPYSPGPIVVNQTWTIDDPGVAHDVYVIVDPQDVVWEFNENDNLAVALWNCIPVDSCVPPARIADNTPALDLKSRGKWIGFKVGPPMNPPCYASDLYLGSFMLNGTLPSDGPAHISNVDEAEWGQHLYLVKFKRADVEAMFPGGGSQVVRISGMCAGTTAPISPMAPMAPACVPTEFCGLDTISIIQPEIQMLTAGQTVSPGSSFPITWVLPAGQEADETSIHYSLDAGTTWTTVAEHYTGPNSYDWSVPAVGTDSAIVAVEVYRNGMLAGQDLSPVFQIANSTTGVSSGLPSRVYLSPAQPSPFGSSTVLRYGLPKAGTVKLSVLDVTGRMVRTLVNGMQAPGDKTAIWNGQDDSGRRVGAGIYLYRLEGLNVVLSQKVVYLR